VTQQVMDALLQAAFPNCDGLPSRRGERLNRAFVPCDIRCNLSFPKFAVGCRELAALTIMSMPEATVDEYSGSKPWQNDIWFSRQVPPMKPKSVPLAVQRRPHGHLGPGVLGSDLRHESRSFAWRKGVGHRTRYRATAGEAP